MGRLLRQLGLAALAAALVQPVSAHAFLDRAVPAVGSSVHASPTELKLWFTERLEPAFSKVRVLDGGGKQVDRGDGRVDATDGAAAPRVAATARAGDLSSDMARVVGRHARHRG